MCHTLHFPLKTFQRMSPFQVTSGILHYRISSTTWIPIEVMHLPPSSHVSLFAGTLYLRGRDRSLDF